MAAVLEKLSTPLTGTSLLQCEEELSKSQNSPVKCISLLDPFLSNHLFSLSDYLLSEAVQHKIRAHTFTGPNLMAKMTIWAGSICNSQDHETFLEV